MKKKIKLLISLLAFFSCNSSKSQLNTAMGLGYDLNGRAIATLSIGATVAKIVEIQAEERPSLSRNSFAHNYIGGSLGLNMLNKDDGLSIILGEGYYYDLKSQDKTSLNKYYFGTFVKSIIMINDNGGLFVQALYINSGAQFTAGIHYKFNKRYRTNY